MLDRPTFLHELRRQSRADTDTRFGTGPHNRRSGLTDMNTIRQRARRRRWSRVLWEWAHGRGRER